MNYQQLQPPAYLQDYVRYFWTLEHNCANAQPRTFVPIADGCPGIIFQPSDTGTFYDQANKSLPSAFLYGQTTKHTELHLSGRLSAIGVYFYPNALRAIFGTNADELTDTCTDLNLLAKQQGFSLSDRLMNAPSTTDQVNVLSAFLFAQIQRGAAVDRLTQYAISNLVQSNGSRSLKELQQDVRLSERGLERRFREFVGIPPKLFARICRFQASMEQLRASHYNNLSDIAFDNGYADQSHFIRTFKEFAGLSPYQYQKQSNEIVANFPQLIR